MTSVGPVPRKALKQNSKAYYLFFDWMKLKGGFEIVFM